MKNLNFITFAALSCAAAMVSCQVEQAETLPAETGMITKTMTVEPNEWLADGTKTSFNGTGIVWNGDETMDVFYAVTGTTPYARVTTPATKNDDGTYTFAHTATEGTSYDYCVITPALPGRNVNGQGTAALYEFSPVQMPGANTYDPNYDILYGKGAANVSANTNLSITEFKRITAPFILEIDDTGNVLGDENIWAVTVAFSAATTNNNALAGLLYVNAAQEVYDNCKINNINPNGNALTALYTDGGLAKSGTSYTVWYSALPCTIAAGCDMTVTIVTDTKTYTKTIATPAEFEVIANKFNNIKVSTANAQLVSMSVYQDFTTVANLKRMPVASDGSDLTWAFSNCAAPVDGILTKGLRFRTADNGTVSEVTLPTFEGYTISKIKLFANPQNANTGNTLYLNGTSVGDYSSWAENGLIKTGGVFEITAIPTDAASLVLTCSGSSFASGIGFELTPVTE